MPRNINKFWDQAVSRLEEESKRVTELFKKKVSPAKAIAEAEKSIKESYERLERLLTVPSRKDLENLRTRLADLAERIEILEEQEVRSETDQEEA